MWIVMTSAAHMPNSCKGRYRNVALVNIPYWLANKGWKPAMISERARGLVKPHGARRSVIHMGHHSVGKTARCAYQRAIAAAEGRARHLNNIHPEALPGEIMTWGGSA